MRQHSLVAGLSAVASLRDYDIAGQLDVCNQLSLPSHPLIILSGLKKYIFEKVKSPISHLLFISARIANAGMPVQMM